MEDNSGEAFCNHSFWACLKCGEYLRGLASQIEKKIKDHQCAGNSMRRDSICKIIAGLQEISASVPPPPPPPPPPPSPLPLRSPSLPVKNHIINQRRKATHERKPKMLLSVVDELKNFFKDGKKLKSPKRLPDS